MAQKKQMKRLGIGAGVVLLGATGMARATEYTWTPTAAGTTYNWNNSGQNNWGTGLGGTFPLLSGDIANLNNNILGNQTIRLQQAVTVGILNLGDLDGSHAFTISTGTGTNALTFDSGSGAAAQLNVRKEGTVSDTISANVVLGSNLDINLEPTTTNGQRHGLVFSGTLDTTTRTINVYGGFKRSVAGDTDATQVTTGSNQDIIGSGTIINNSDSPWVIGGIKSFTGTLVANGPGIGGDGNTTGSFVLSNGYVPNAAEIIINGGHDGTNFLGGKIRIGTGSTITQPTVQRLSQNRVTLNGGFLDDAAVGINPSNTSFVNADTVAVIDFNSGFNWITVAAAASTAGNRLTGTTIERGAGATAFVRAPVAGATFSQFKAGPSFDINQLVKGSTDTTGAATRIIPWMVASTNISNLGIGSFATYDTAEGFRALKTGEFSSGTLATGANVSVSNASQITGLTTNWTINSLYHGHSGTAVLDNVDNAGRTITITSGGLIFATNGGAIGTAGNTDSRAGVLDFGGNEAVITNAFANINGIGSNIIATNGLTKGGTGKLVLTGTNTISGAVHVSGGILQVGDGPNDSTLGNASLVRIHNGATLQLSNSDAILDATDIRLDSFGLLNGKVALDADVDDTISALFLNGVAVAPDTYTLANLGNLTGWVTFGSAGSSLTVTAVPEPASLSLLALGGLGLLRRRRRA